MYNEKSEMKQKNIRQLTKKDKDDAHEETKKVLFWK
jgi:hypothetical protein